MQPSSLDFLIAGVALLIFAGGIRTAVFIAMRLRAGLPLIAFEPRGPVPWGPVDLLLIVTVYILLHLVATRGMLTLTGIDLGQIVAADEKNGADPQKMVALLIANAVANVATAALAIGFVRLGSLAWKREATGMFVHSGHFYFRPGARADDLGFRLTRLTGDVRLGAAAFSVAIVPIYVLQAVLSHFFTKQHPIVDMLEQSPEVALLALAVVAAVVVAPIAEEFFFRVLLQGWLEKVWEIGEPARELTAGDEALAEGAVAIASDIDPRAPVRWPPILISSFVFALLHFNNGPDPIPLFLLAVVLGYLYQRTHRIWPSVVLHFCLNATSLLLLWTEVSRLAVE